MKKILTTFIALALFIPCVFAHSIRANIYSKRLPKGTKMSLVMDNFLATNQMQVHDMFSAKITKDVKLKYSTVLPRGTIIRGTIDDFKHNGMLSKSAKLYLKFDHLVTPSGRQIPVNAVVCSHFELTDDGAITDGGTYGDEFKRNLNKSGEIIKKTSSWGVKSGDELFKGGRFLIAPIAFVGGTIGAGGYLVVDSLIDVFKFGNEVVIDQGTKFDVILLEPLDVPTL